MARQSMFVHGNSVVVKYPGGKGDPIGGPHTGGHQMNGVSLNGEGRIEWSDVVGLRDVIGARFRGRNNQTNTFYASVPTPVYRDNVRARLARVAVNFSADPGVVIEGITVSDGARALPFPFPPMALGGSHCNTWDANVNYFDHPSPPEIRSCIGLGFHVRFAEEGDIQFCVIGCDFLV